MRLVATIIAAFICFAQQQFDVESAAFQVHLCLAKCSCVLDQVWCANASLVSVPTLLASNITFLDLQQNFIHHLPRLLSSYQNLGFLDLTNNQIHAIDSQAFHHLRQLQSLSLCGNRLKTRDIASSAVWHDLTNLRILSLCSNRLGPKLRGKPFSPLTSLVELDLSFNPIKHLSVQVFTGLSSLNVLRLKSTLLTSVPSVSLSKLDNLQQLDLSATNIHMIEDFSFRSVGRQLRLLYLDEMALLSKLGDKSFNSLENLLELHMSSCSKLRDIPAGALDTLCALEFLHLEKNALVTLPNVLFASAQCKASTLSEKPYSVDSSRRQVFLEGNPLHCNCSLLWLRNELSSASASVISSGSVYCASPSYLAGTRLAAVPEVVFTCNERSSSTSQASAEIVSQLSKFQRLGKNKNNCTSIGDNTSRRHCSNNSDNSSNNYNANAEVSNSTNIQRTNVALIAVTVTCVAITLITATILVIKCFMTMRRRDKYAEVVYVEYNNIAADDDQSSSDDDCI